MPHYKISAILPFTLANLWFWVYTTKGLGGRCTTDGLVVLGEEI